MKKLILIPVIHAEGTNSEVLDTLINSQFEDLNLRRKNLWNLVHERVSKLAFDPAATKLFVDSNTKELRPEDSQYLHEPSHREELKKMIAEKLGFGEGEMNLILSLVAQGVPLMKTEEKEHVLESQENMDELVRVISEIADSDEEYVKEDEVRRVKECFMRMADSVAKRDKDIVENVKKQLAEGEIGILILGRDHQVWDKFGNDIQIEFLDPELEKLALEGKGSIRELLSEGDKPSMEYKG